MANTRVFKDIDLSFQKNPITNDISKKIDTNAIKQSIKNLVLTRLYSSPFHPEIGSQVGSLLFEPYSNTVKISLERIIASCITNFEPRVELKDVIVSNEETKNSISVTIYYTIINSDKPQTYNFSIYRTR